MCNCLNNKCAECGSPAISVQEAGYTCDNCSRYICDACWNKMNTVHVKTPTKAGIVGFVKLCKQCRTRCEEASVQPNPFIG